ncbi:unnamed protein product [Leptosia nina]|uniref:Uncharacterized protein n=1 Tax=Leptosia nina TaxID=320188 RepID=A0AAV1JJL9_9NEOP
MIVEATMGTSLALQVKSKAAKISPFIIYIYRATAAVRRDLSENMYSADADRAATLVGTWGNLHVHIRLEKNPEWRTCVYIPTRVANTR